MRWIALIFFMATGAQAACIKPNVTEAMAEGRACINESKSVASATICSLAYDRYNQHFDQWKACRIAEIVEQYSSEILRFTADTDAHSKRMRKHALCISLGKLGASGTDCDIGN